MPIEHLLRALPLVLALGLAPGFAIATLVMPRLTRLERLAAAPGLSIGCVGGIGLVLHIIHVPFEPLTVLPLLMLVAAAAVFRARRDGENAAQSPRIVLACALLSGLTVAAVVTAALRDDPLPPGDDPALHGAVAASIARDHDVLPAVPIPVTGSAFVRPQGAFEATAALVSQLGGGSPSDVLMPLVLLSLALLPLGVAVLAIEVTGDVRVGAVTALLCPGLVFPFSPVAFGGYPYIVDSTLVVPLILAAARCLKGERVRDSAAMCAAAVAAIWFIHGLELVSAAILGAPLWVALLLRGRSIAVRGALTAAGASLAAAATGWILTRPPALPASPVSDAAAQPSEAAAYLIGHADVGVRTVLDAFTGSDLSVLTTVLVVVGIVALLLRRANRWLIVSLVLPLLCVYDVAGPERLHRLWLRLYPWTVTDRLLGLEFFVVPVIAGIGVVAAASFAAERMRSASGSVPVVRRATLLGGLLAVSALCVGSVRSWQLLSSQIPPLERASSQDVAVIHALESSLPQGSVVLNHADGDAGEWIDAMTADAAAEPKPYASGNHDDWRVHALANACADPQGAADALRGMQAVFVGAQVTTGAPDPWQASCVARIPSLRLVAGSVDGAAGFVVES